MLARSTSTNKPDVVVHVHTPNYIGNIGSRVMVQGSPGQKPWGLMWKIIKAKRTGVMAQKVRYLPSKCEALNSNPSTAKKKKKIYHSVYSWMCFSPFLSSPYYKTKRTTLLSARVKYTQHLNHTKRVWTWETISVKFLSTLLSGLLLDATLYLPFIYRKLIIQQTLCYYMNIVR
jgi:hypothetical protein